MDTVSPQHQNRSSDGNNSGTKRDTKVDANNGVNNEASHGAYNGSDNGANNRSSIQYEFGYGTEPISEFERQSLLNLEREREQLRERQLERQRISRRHRECEILLRREVARVRERQCQRQRGRGLDGPIFERHYYPSTPASNLNELVNTPEQRPPHLMPDEVAVPDVYAGLSDLMNRFAHGLREVQAQTLANDLERPDHTYNEELESNLYRNQRMNGPPPVLRGEAGSIEAQILERINPTNVLRTPRGDFFPLDGAIVLPIRRVRRRGDDSIDTELRRNWPFAGDPPENPFSAAAAGFIQETYGFADLTYSILLDTHTGIAWPFYTREVNNAHHMVYSIGSPFQMNRNDPEDICDPENLDVYVRGLERVDEKLRQRMARIGMSGLAGETTEDGLTPVGCAICHEEYKQQRVMEYPAGGGYEQGDFDDSDIVVIPCRGHHTLHAVCLRGWLEHLPMSKWSCPFCRDLLPKDRDSIIPMRTLHEDIREIERNA